MTSGRRDAADVQVCSSSATDPEDEDCRQRDNPHDLVTSPAYIVIKAAAELKDKTTAPTQLWQTDFNYLKITGWGWYYLKRRPAGTFPVVR